MIWSRAETALEWRDIRDVVEQHSAGRLVISVDAVDTFALDALLLAIGSVQNGLTVADAGVSTLPCNDPCRREELGFAQRLPRGDVY